MIKTYKFNKIADNRGALTPIEELLDIPFLIKRVYYMYDTDKNIIRGKHSHKSLEQVLICVSGECSILLDNGLVKETIRLYEKNYGIYIGPNIWHEMFDFKEGSVLIALASDYYDESDYIRDYDEFLAYVIGGNYVNELWVI